MAEEGQHLVVVLLAVKRAGAPEGDSVVEQSFALLIAVRPVVPNLLFVRGRIERKVDGLETGRKWVVDDDLVMRLGRLEQKVDQHQVDEADGLSVTYGTSSTENNTASANAG